MQKEGCKSKNMSEKETSHHDKHLQLQHTFIRTLLVHQLHS